MKSKVTLETTLESTEGTFYLLAPCTYCNQPIEGGKKSMQIFNTQYPLKYVRITRMGNFQVFDQSGDKNGTVVIHAPYCEKHKKGSCVTEIPPCLLNYYFIFGASFFLTFYTIGDWLPYSFLSFTEDFYILVAIAAFFLWFAILTGIRYLIESALRKIPRYRDYPIGEGGLGLGISVNDHPDYRNMKVDYSLNLDFHNVEAAKRFYKAFPQQFRAIKGKEFLID